MRKFLIFFLNICAFQLFFFSPSFAKVEDEAGLIWDYRSDRFLDALKDGKGIYDDATQKDLDEQIKEGLEINLIPIDLECCLTLAIEYNNKVKISEQNKEEYRWKYMNALAQLLPDFYYRYQIQNLRGEFLVGDVLPRVIRQNPIYSGLTFDYPLIGNGSTLFDIAAAKNTYKSTKHSYQFSKKELLLNTTLYYYELLEAKLNIEVLLLNLRDRAEQLRLMQARYHIGIGTKYDILRAEAQYADAKQQIIAALYQLRLKQAQLAKIMGIDVALTLYPFEHGATPRELVNKKNGLESLFNVALQSREDVKAKRAEIRALNNVKNRNYTDFAPRVNLSYEFARVGTTETGSLRPNHTWSLNAEIPLGKKLGVGTLTQKNADLAKVRRARLELTKLEREIKENLISSFYNSRTALEKIEANKKQVASADEGLKFSLIGFDVGQNTFIDVLTSQTEKTEARQQLIGSIIQYNKAQAQLLFDTGTITKEALLMNYEGICKNNKNNTNSKNDKNNKNTNKK